MVKRIFDFVFSLVALTLLVPVFVVVIMVIIALDGFPVFYSQKRVGKNGVLFNMYKFRTMHKDADSKGLLTVGGKDARITKSGYFLRKYKMDELPQLFNVLIGSMSIVGPRPEVMKYVALYTEEQKKILLVKPGITDYASIEYSNESELLGKSADPHATYINEIMPKKIKLNIKYIEKKGLITDIAIVINTLKKILRG